MPPQPTPHPLTARWRPEFPGLERSVYMNTCSLGQLSRRSMDGMQRFQEQWLSYGASAWYELWLGEMADARARFARLIDEPYMRWAHSNPVTTAIYNRRGEQAIRAAASKLHVPYKRRYSDGG